MCLENLHGTIPHFCRPDFEDVEDAADNHWHISLEQSIITTPLQSNSKNLIHIQYKGSKFVLKRMTMTWFKYLLYVSALLNKIVDVLWIIHVFWGGDAHPMKSSHGLIQHCS